LIEEEEEETNGGGVRASREATSIQGQSHVARISIAESSQRSRL